MAYRELLPAVKTDQPIRPNDTGPAVEKFQTFLQTLPEVQQWQAGMADYGKGYSLTDTDHYGKFDLDTGKALKNYQLKNKSRIVKAGVLSEQEWQNEINNVGFSTWKIMQEDMGVNTTDAPEAAQAAIPSPVEEKLPDPPAAASNKEATHYIKTVNPEHRLAIRLGPAYEAVSKEVAEDEDKKGERVGMMPNGTLIKIIEPHVGYHCEWHQIEVVDSSPEWVIVKDLQKTKPLFCFAEFVQPCQQTPKMLAINCEDCSPKPYKKKVFPDWPDKGLCEPWYEDCNYYITVPTKHESSNSDILSAQGAEAMAIGVENMLSFYNKQRKAGDIKEYLSAFRFAEIDDWYLGERPKSKLKFLVRIPAKYLDAIPENTENWDGIPTAEAGNFPVGWKTIHFSSAVIEENVENVARILDLYMEDVKEWQGHTADFDFWEEAERLRSFIPVFKRFLEWNDSPLSPEEEESYEIGFSGPCYKLEYVLYGDGMYSTPLRIGLDCFKRSEPIIFERTMSFLFFLDEIIREAKKGKIPWSVFINKYACPPVVIRPSATPPPAKIKEQPVISEQPIKTEKEKKQEDEIVESPTLKQRLKEVRQNVMLYVGDSLLSCETLPQLLDKMTSLEELYSKVLNKVDIKDITGFVAACLIGRLEIPDLRMIACKFVLRHLKIDQLQQLMTMFDNTVLSQIEDKLKCAQANPVGQMAQDDATNLRNVIQMAASEEEICRTLTAFDPALIEEKMRMLSSFKLPQFIRRKIAVPTISLPDGLATEDIMAEIVNLIIETVYKLLSIVLIELVKALFRALCEQCKPSRQWPEKYGDANLNDILKKANGFPNDIGGKLFDDFGSNVGDQRDLLNQQMKDFFDDLSALLKPSELCALLNGQASEEVINVIRVLIVTKYPMIADWFSSKSKIRDLFTYIGKFLPNDVCEAIVNAGNSIPFTDICGISTENEVRKALLSQKLSPAQVETQMEALKERNKKRLAQLMDLMDDNLLDNILPPISHDPCKPGASIVPHDPPSIKHMNNQLVDQVFGSLKTIFNQDLSGFLYNLINSKDMKIDMPDIANAEMSINANRKYPLKDLSPEEKDALKDNPDGSGRVLDKNNAMVAIELFEGLTSPKVDIVYKEDKDYHNDNASYVLKNCADSIENTIRIWASRQKEAELASFLPNIFNSIVSANPGTKLAETLNAHYGVTEEEICEDMSFSSAYFSALSMPTSKLISSNTVVRYSLIKRPTAELEDHDEIIVNKNEDNRFFIYQHDSKIREDLKELVSKYIKLPIITTTKQEVFAKFMTNALFPYIESFSAQTAEGFSDVDPKGLIFSYFKNDAFHKVVVGIMRILLYNIGRSKLFLVKEFQKIDFIGTAEKMGVCPPDQEGGILDVEEIKKLVQERYQKSINECSQKDTSIAPIEKANLEGIIIALVRVYVIEVLLKAMFVFSRYKLSAIVEDPFFIKYITWEIEEDIKKNSIEFYNIFLEQSKKVVENRGDRIQYGDTKSVGEKQNNNELLSDYQSGLVFLEYLIKQQLESLAPKLENLLLVDEMAMYQKVFVDQLPIEDVPPIEGVVGDAFAKFKEDYKNGGFRLEKYVRVHRDNASDYVLSWDEFKAGTDNGEFGWTSPEKCGHIGLRLVYIPPLEGEYTFQELWEGQSLKVKPDVRNNWRAYSINNDYVHPIVLVVLEEDKEVSNRDANGIDFIGYILLLKEKLYSSDQLKLFFDYIFDTKEYLSLATTYSINIVEKNIEGIKESFDSTKRYLRILFRTLVNTDKQDWWRREDDEVQKLGGNQGLFQERMDNIKASGPAAFLAGLAAKTVPIIIKGCAEKFDTAYKLLKLMDDAGATMFGLTWPSMLAQVMPINIIPPPIGFGPPITPYGILALSLELLSGELRDKQRRENEKNINKEIEKNGPGSIGVECKEGGGGGGGGGGSSGESVAGEENKPKTVAQRLETLLTPPPRLQEQLNTPPTEGYRVINGTPSEVIAPTLPSLKQRIMADMGLTTPKPFITPRPGTGETTTTGGSGESTGGSTPPPPPSSGPPKGEKI